jgi:hypothetical protein
MGFPLLSVSHLQGIPDQIRVVVTIVTMPERDDDVPAVLSQEATGNGQLALCVG